MRKAIIDNKIAAYTKASKKEKTSILNELVSSTGGDRKSIIKRLNRPLHKKRRAKHKGKSPPRGRPRKYGADVEAALAYIWEAYDCPSAERLYGELNEAVRIFKRDHMWDFLPTTTDNLLSMSLGSMKLRTVAMAQKKGLMRGLSTTRPSDIKLAIPIFTGDWSNRGLGHGQIDTVVHSGPKLMGTMAYTVNFVDSVTYWQEPIAQLEKSEKATVASMKKLQERLPFPLRGLHPDTGSEFINWTTKAWCDKEGIELTRSRPHKKNDNCFIEQRNNVVVRKYVGYERYDCQEAVKALNELYTTLRLYLNFFQPTFKLTDKAPRISSKGYRRVYDDPATPLQRLLALPDAEVPAKTKASLKKQYEALNPKLLRDRIQTLTIKLQRIQRELGYHY